MVMVAHLGSFGGASINIYEQDIFISEWVLLLPAADVTA